MRAIQKYLPEPRHTEIHRIFVYATPEVAWPVARHFDAGEIPWVRAVFDLRTLPSRLMGGAGTEQDPHIGIDQIARNNHGFHVLDEEPGRYEVVVGAIGQFWHLDIPFREFEREGFAGFNESGWGKVAWSISVEPYQSGSMITLELRTTATDDASWRRLSRYFLLIGPVSHLIRSSVMAHLEAELSPLTRPDDSQRALPGDNLLAASRYRVTQHTDIEAPPAIVWRYLMQLGCDRAGWYSIDALDNAGVKSKELLIPGWEERAVGDRVAAVPDRSGYFDVLQVEPERVFTLGGTTERFGGRFEMNWSFVLEPLGADATHLVVRARMKAAPKWSEWLQGNVLYPPVHALMQGVQLHNLKRVAEREAQRRATVPATLVEAI
jgi:hypothetical protein